MFGMSLLCGIGFTMSLFIGLLAFDAPAMQDRVKFGILAGSLVAGWPAMRQGTRNRWKLMRKGEGENPLPSPITGFSDGMR
jgi:hypothetical protein